MKKTILILLALAVALLLSAAAGEDEKIFTSGGFEYVILPGGGAELIRYTGPLGVVCLPDNLDGHPVTSVRGNPFAGDPNSGSGTEGYALYRKAVAENMLTALECMAMNRQGMDNIDGYLDQMERNMTAYRNAGYTPDEQMENAMTRAKRAKSEALSLQEEEKKGITSRYAQLMELVNTAPDSPDALDYNRTTLFKLVNILRNAVGRVAIIREYDTQSSEAVAKKNADSLYAMITKQAPGLDLGEQFIPSRTSLEAAGDALLSEEYKSFAYDFILTVSGNHPFLTVIDGALFDTRGKRLICCPPTREGVYSVPDWVEVIGEDAFSGCLWLSEVVIPAGVTCIEARAFMHCSGLESAVLGSGLSVIGDYAFSGCDALTRVAIPGSVTRIGESAFAACGSLTAVTAGGSDAAPAVSANGNQAAEIGSFAFADCPALTSVTIPAGISRIGAYAFCNCTALTEATIAENVTDIGDFAFYNCRSLAAMVLPDSVTRIGQWAFSDCRSLAAVALPDSVTRIGQWAFSDCRGLVRVNVPAGVKEIGDYAFYYCTSLADVTLAEGVESIGEKAFAGCESLTGLTLPGSLTAIGDYAFYACTGLAALDLPDRVADIGDYAFYLCTALTGMELPDSVTAIGSGVFCACDGLTDMVIPDSVTVIGDRAFFDCTGLTGITIPDSVTAIGRQAFSLARRGSGEIIPIPGLTFTVTAGSRAEEYCRNSGLAYRYAED